VGDTDTDSGELFLLCVQLSTRLLSIPTIQHAASQQLSALGFSLVALFFAPVMQ
jgi:hypothetical protein